MPWIKKSPQFLTLALCVFSLLASSAAPEGNQSPAKTPIPEDWLSEHHQSTSDPNIASADPDGDGFTNEEEWRGHTDPEDKNSHPPYQTKLFFVRRILVQFRIRFMATDGDPRNSAEMSFQINTLDLRQPSEFLKLGEMIPHTKFKLTKFEYKMVNDPVASELKDVSELTITDVGTGETTVLTKERIFDTPDDFAEFSYEWHLSGQPRLAPFKVKRGGVFVLPPDPAAGGRKYRLLDIKEKEVVIQTPEGEKVTIPRDRR